MEEINRALTMSDLEIREFKRREERVSRLYRPAGVESREAKRRRKQAEKRERQNA